MADQRPNIVLIITDQQRYDTIAALGFPYVDTPNLDRLVHEGVSFSNNFVTAASCVFMQRMVQNKRHHQFFFVNRVH